MTVLGGYGQTSPDEGLHGLYGVESLVERLAFSGLRDDFTAKLADGRRPYEEVGVLRV